MQGSVLLPFRSSFHVYDAMTNLSIVEKQYSTGEELEEKVRVYQETNMERLWSSTLPPPRNMLSSLGSAGSCRTLPGEWKALTFSGCIWISYQATRGSWTIHGRGWMRLSDEAIPWDMKGSILLSFTPSAATSLPRTGLATRQVTLLLAPLIPKLHWGSI